MKAFHVISTKPSCNYYVASHEKYLYGQEDFEIFSIVLSAMEWRRHNGTIRLYTDIAGQEFYNRLGLVGLWDGGIDTEHLERASRKINCRVFWSFGKIIALRNEAAPCCVMDTDLIVWRGIQNLVYRKLMSLHEEPLEFAAYVHRDRLIAPARFDWSGLDWSVAACSAAFLVFGEDDFKNEYADRALTFMKENPIQSEVNWTLPAHPIFVEQRLLPMCAKRQDVKIGFFLRDYMGVELHSGMKNTGFTHLWNAKTLLFNDPRKRMELCRKYAKRIRRDYPDVADMLAQAQQLAKYFRNINDEPSGPSGP